MPRAKRSPAPGAAVPASARVTHELLLLSAEIALLTDAVTRDRGIHPTDAAALHYIASAPRSMSELASALRLTRAAATAVVDRLEAAGLAERSRPPEDRRRVIVSATQAAIEPHARIVELAARVEALIASHPPRELATIERFLTNVRETLAGEDT